MATRIYQSSIIEVEKNGRPFPAESFEETFRLFQDAVNYYIVALSGLGQAGEENQTLGGAFRSKVEAIWQSFPKGKRNATTLQQSLCRTLGMQNASFDEVVGKIFKDGERPEIRPYVLRYIMDSVGKGEGQVRNNGHELLPKLCYPSFGGNFAFSAKQKLADHGLEKLRQALTSDNADEWVCIASQMDLSWAGVKTQNEYYELDETVNEVKTAITELLKVVEENPAKYETRTSSGYDGNLIADIKYELQRLPSNFNRRLAKNNKTDLDLKRAAIFFMFCPCQASAWLLAGKLPKSKKYQVVDYDYVNLEDDPIIMTRGNRKYVFPAFSCLDIWHMKKECRRWDNPAFIEALKVLHGFVLKTEERRNERDELEKEIDYILTGKGRISPDDGEEEDGMVVLGGDPRFELLEKLVKELRQNEEDEDYGINSRTLKGFDDLQTAWKKSIEHGKSGKADMAAIVRSVQSSGGPFGSQPLFEALCSEEYRAIWCEPAPQDKFPRSTNVLRDFAALQRRKRKVRQLKEPVRLTAAECKASPRMLLYETSGSNDMEASFVEAKSATVDMAIAVRNADDRYELTKVRVRFSAPRLIRDKVVGENMWLQPMMKALSLEEKVCFDDKPPFSLCVHYPKSEGSGEKDSTCKLYLTFMPTLNMKPLHRHIGKADLWRGQFNKTNHLSWDRPAKETPWWEKPEIRGRGFTVLGVDLGMRTGCAWNITNVSRNSAQSARLVGTSQDRTKWYGLPVKQGLLRLDGEGSRKGDAKAGELQAPAGIRSASDREWELARNILNRILPMQSVEDLMKRGANVLKLGNQLLRAFRRHLSRYRQYLFMLNHLREAAQIDEELDNIKKYFGYNDVTRRYIPGILEACDQKDSKRVFDLLVQACLDMKQGLPSLAEEITFFILPRRKGAWRWIADDSRDTLGAGCMETDASAMRPGRLEKVLIRNMGGISIARLTQLEELRQRIQSMNRLLSVVPGQPPLCGRGGRDKQIDDPCPEILEKIDNIRLERVNQIAHGIVAQALGVRLLPPREGKNESGKDIIHGEYERIPGRNPVDFVVMENLSKYKMDISKSREENTTLMRWAHRQIIDKVRQLLEEVFGIPVLEAPPAYTSRFDCMTSAPGFRPCELSVAYLKGQEKHPELQAIGRTYEKVLQPMIDSEVKTPKGWHLLMPDPTNSGEYFLSWSHDTPLVERHADINAAVNIAWRGIAAPESLHLLHRIRMERKKNKVKMRNENKREKAMAKARITVTSDYPQSGYFNAFFNASADIANDCDIGGIPMAYGKKLWGIMKSRHWRMCHLINIKRLKKLGLDVAPILQLTMEDDDAIPL